MTWRRWPVVLACVILLGSACGSESSGDEPGTECVTDSDCTGYHSAGRLCRKGRCQPCASDGDCGDGRCQDGHCYACLTDPDCSAATPYCAEVPEPGTPAARMCFECTKAQHCDKGKYCLAPWQGAFGPGGECHSGQCAEDPKSSACEGCVRARGASCTACVGLTGNAQLDCMTACVGDLCD